jgi:hypothetical protein
VEQAKDAEAPSLDGPIRSGVREFRKKSCHTLIFGPMSPDYELLRLRRADFEIYAQSRMNSGDDVLSNVESRVAIQGRFKDCGLGQHGQLSAKD